MDLTEKTAFVQRFEGDEGVSCVSIGKSGFWLEGKATAKTVRWQHAWYIQGIERRPVLAAVVEKIRQR